MNKYQLRWVMMVLALIWMIQSAVVNAGCRNIWCSMGSVKEDGERICAAVVVSPGIALTALSCVQDTGSLEFFNKKRSGGAHYISGMHEIPKYDIAVLELEPYSGDLIAPLAAQDLDLHYDRHTIPSGNSFYKVYIKEKNDGGIKKKARYYSHITVVTGDDGIRFLKSGDLYSLDDFLGTPLYVVRQTNSGRYLGLLGIRVYDGMMLLDDKVVNAIERVANDFGDNKFGRFLPNLDGDNILGGVQSIWTIGD